MTSKKAMLRDFDVLILKVDALTVSRSRKKSCKTKERKLGLIHQQHSWYRIEMAVTDMQTRSRPAQQRVEEEFGESEQGERAGR